MPDEKWDFQSRKFKNTAAILQKILEDHSFLIRHLSTEFRRNRSNFEGVTLYKRKCLKQDHCNCGGSRLRPWGSQAPKSCPGPQFLIGFIVISLSRFCLPNDEGSAPQYLFLEPPPALQYRREAYITYYRERIDGTPLLNFQPLVLNIFRKFSQ